MQQKPLPQGRSTALSVVVPVLNEERGLDPLLARLRPVLDRIGPDYEILIVDEVLAANAQQVADYRGGKEKAFNSLVGQVMKATRGKANPQQVNDILKRAFEADEDENRRLGRISQMIAKVLRGEAWLDDRFGFRGTLIRWHNLVKVLGFGVSPSEELALGPEHWIFTAADRALEAHRGLAPLSPELLELWKRVFEQRRDWLRERGFRTVILLANSGGGLVVP